MDYLDLINGVLRRLRENTVSSIYENTLSSLIAEYINDAKRQVENSHSWTALRQDITFGTSDGVTTYDLDGSQNRITIIDVRDVTNNAMLRPVSAAYIRQSSLIENLGTSRPSYYATEGVAANGDTKMKLWPVPNGTYTIKVHAVQRTPDLAAEGDILSVPSQPVILLAYAMAAQDRGDVDGADLQTLYGAAKRSLADHIMLDAAHNPQEMVWFPI
jgi:hypothetical protein